MDTNINYMHIKIYCDFSRFIIGRHFKYKYVQRAVDKNIEIDYRFSTNYLGIPQTYLSLDIRSQI